MERGVMFDYRTAFAHAALGDGVGLVRSREHTTSDNTLATEGAILTPKGRFSVEKWSLTKIKV